ncbi:resolvase-like serine recombinase [Geobacter metallireducens GS-15]|uniref:Resolvase-like serine recombinase n=1 Tax=Geobacter metallireducens (strain ATCC 53774 / DSM 7210 / GS-15) TaxID=269799 RepID=Q39TB8_GEOMG|nr:recombinase family protein [Geobacter metallireducens]ABB32506.1 resolvase-like serine recombinase [Geobacter metallireducens GS-15]
MKRYVSYLRVSTDKQGREGYGVGAQREAVANYLNGGKWELLREFVEVESGRKKDRPELAAALSFCKLTKSTLIVAKLDRLARNVAFVSSLMESGVDFVAVDFPEANKLTVHILAAVAEHEAGMISTRTKAALAAARTRGVKLGNPNLTNEARSAGRVARAMKSDEDAKRVKPIIEGLRLQGMGLRETARELNRQGIRTPLGKDWTATAVKNAMARW